MGKMDLQTATPQAQAQEVEVTPAAPNRDILQDSSLGGSPSDIDHAREMALAQAPDSDIMMGLGEDSLTTEGIMMEQAFEKGLEEMRRSSQFAEIAPEDLRKPIDFDIPEPSITPEPTLTERVADGALYVAEKYQEFAEEVSPWGTARNISKTVDSVSKAASESGLTEQLADGALQVAEGYQKFAEEVSPWGTVKNIKKIFRSDQEQD